MEYPTIKVTTPVASFEIEQKTICIKYSGDVILNYLDYGFGQ